MTDADREKWDRKYTEKSAISVPEPDQWLMKCVKDLPPGRALDLACGLGQNALQLSELGWKVDAVDISEIGLKIPQEISETMEFPVNWECADLDKWQSRQEYDLIVVFRFLDWSTVTRIVEESLKPGGYLCYETFAESQCSRPDNHLSNQAFTVCEGDWLRYFPRFESLEEHVISLEDRDVARYFGQRPGC